MTRRHRLECAVQSIEPGWARPCSCFSTFDWLFTLSDDELRMYHALIKEVLR